MIEEGVLDLLMCFDRRFLIGAAVSMRSLCENASQNGSLRFTILTTDLTAADEARLRETLEGFPVRDIRIQRVDTGAFDSLLRSKHVSHTAYARILAGDVMPSSVDRVVYVDADVLFLRDVWELADVPLGGHVLAAIPNEDEASQQRQLQRLGVTADSYFASGLMVIDLPRWRALNIGQNAIDFARSVGDRLLLHDQDALNGAIRGRYQHLPDIWGHWSIAGVPQTRSVIHYAMSPKPWHADYRGAFRDEFFACLDRTSFAGWRPPHLFGLAPVAARFRRRLPYLPTVFRMIRKRLRA